MKYLFVIFCLLLFVFACQSDLSDDVKDNNENIPTYGEAVYGKSEYEGIK